MTSSLLTRRIGSGVASLLVGLAGALVIASPASAHHPDVDGSAVCDEQTGEWVITWTVANSETDLTGTITAVTVDPVAGFTTIVVGATLPVQGDGPLTEPQRVPGSTTHASLNVTVEWLRDYRTITRDGSKKLELGGECAPPADDRQPVESEFDCETLTITLTNPLKEEATFLLTPSVGDPATGSLPAGGSTTVEFPASDGLTVEVQLADATLEQPIEITPAEWAALECDGDDDGEGGGLPQTGTSTTLIAGGALSLLVLGAGLYLVARRRRITFTAG